MNKITITKEELQKRIEFTKNQFDIIISSDAMLDILNWDYMIGKNEDFYVLEDQKGNL